MLDLVDECEDPHMRLVYAGKHSFASLSLTVVCVSVCVCVGLHCDLGLMLAVCNIILYIYIYMSTMRSKEPGSHLIQFLVRLMKWLIMGALHL
jgi:ABC-type protease/lipase transport system fused ATPase/permease subunit